MTTQFPAPPLDAGRRISVGEVALHVVELGPADGPLVLLLHGFPAFWWSWRAQLEPLAAAGFRVVAPDLRGYDRSDRPRGIAAYRMPHLCADVEGLIRALGHERAHVVGHDWGGAIAWSFAERHPERVASLAVLNCPHPRALFKALSRPAQLKRSWYILAFQIPWLPEHLLMARDAAILRKLLGSLSERDVEPYVAAARRGGNLREPIHYYRAAAREALSARSSPAVIQARTLVLWGLRDPVFERDLAWPDPRSVPYAEVETIEQAGHDVHRDAAERVNARLIAHLRGGASA